MVRTRTSGLAPLASNDPTTLSLPASAPIMSGVQPSTVRAWTRAPLASSQSTASACANLAAWFHAASFISVHVLWCYFILGRTLTASDGIPRCYMRATSKKSNKPHVTANQPTGEQQRKWKRQDGAAIACSQCLPRPRPCKSGKPRRLPHLRST